MADGTVTPPLAAPPPAPATTVNDPTGGIEAAIIRGEQDVVDGVFARGARAERKRVNAQLGARFEDVAAELAAGRAARGKAEALEAELAAVRSASVLSEVLGLAGIAEEHRQVVAEVVASRVKMVDGKAVAVSAQGAPIEAVDLAAEIAQQFSALRTRSNTGMGAGPGVVVTAWPGGEPGGQRSVPASQDTIRSNGREVRIFSQRENVQAMEQLFARRGGR